MGLTTFTHCSPGSVVVSAACYVNICYGHKIQGESIPLFRVLDCSGVLSAQTFRAAFMISTPVAYKIDPTDNTALGWFSTLSCFTLPRPHLLPLFVSQIKLPAQKPVYRLCHLWNLG